MITANQVARFRPAPSTTYYCLQGRSRINAVFRASRFYHDNVIDHYENPRNVGSLDKNKKNVGTGFVSLILVLFLALIRGTSGLVGAPACGDVMKLQIEVDSNGVIVDAKFKTFGCGSAIGLKLNVSPLQADRLSVIPFSVVFICNRMAEGKGCRRMPLNKGESQKEIEVGLSLSYVS